MACHTCNLLVNLLEYNKIAATKLEILQICCCGCSYELNFGEIVSSASLVCTGFVLQWKFDGWQWAALRPQAAGAIVWRAIVVRLSLWTCNAKLHLLVYESAWEWRIFFWHKLAAFLLLCFTNLFKVTLQRHCGLNFYFR